jgi:hypothetical protein
MKVTRQILSEEYNTTVDWINDFAKNLEKNADYLSNLRSVMKKRNDFSTIEEKMADLKERAGFDLIKNINTKNNQNIKSAGCGDTCRDEKAGKGKCGACESKKNNSGEILEVLRSILEYIQAFVADRTDLCYGAIMTHCREHPKLGFDKVEKKIDHSKFKNLVEKILKQHKSSPEKVEYMSEADMPSSYDDDIADYMSHASG